jgi:hypothetical protein
MKRGIRFRLLLWWYRLDLLVHRLRILLIDVPLIKLDALLADLGVKRITRCRVQTLLTLGPIWLIREELKIARLRREIHARIAQERAKGRA